MNAADISTRVLAVHVLDGGGPGQVQVVVQEMHFKTLLTRIRSIRGGEEVLVSEESHTSRSATAAAPAGCKGPEWYALFFMARSAPLQWPFQTSHGVLASLATRQQGTLEFVALEFLQLESQVYSSCTECIQRSWVASSNCHRALHFYGTIQSFFPR
jgi:hypothetical protein